MLIYNNNLNILKTNMNDKSIFHIGRKNTVTITLVQTPQGYSVLEGNEQVNKSSTTISASNPPKQRVPSHQQIPKRQNVIIPIYPYTTNKIVEKVDKHITLPSCAAWFNFYTVHEIQRKALPEWFKSKKGAIKSDKFEKSEELYLKYRNYIVELGKQGYVSATRARKGLAGDACSIMRIHAFLEHWGIINKYSLKGQAPNHTRQLIMKFDEDHRQDLFEYDKKLIGKTYGQEDADLLRRTTKKYRPLCDFCTQRCGIVWFQHKRALNSKDISQIMKSVNPKNPPLSTTQYQISLCLKCFSQGNFPIIFTSNDFSKITIQEKLDEVNKSKKRKDKEKGNGEQNTNGGMDVEWSLSQIDKMLSLAQKNGDNWQETAAQFPGRTAQQVLLCFLTLPIKNVSKIKFENETADFVKQNTNELSTNFSSNICTSALEVISKQKVQINLPANIQTPVSKQEYQLFQQIVRLQLKRASLKMGQLWQWESYLQTQKRQIEQGRKTVIAQKLRALGNQL